MRVLVTKKCETPLLTSTSAMLGKQSLVVLDVVQVWKKGRVCTGLRMWSGQKYLGLVLSECCS